MQEYYEEPTSCDCLSFCFFGGSPNFLLASPSHIMSFPSPFRRSSIDFKLSTTHLCGWPKPTPTPSNRCLLISSGFAESHSLRKAGMRASTRSLVRGSEPILLRAAYVTIAHAGNDAVVSGWWLSLRRAAAVIVSERGWERWRAWIRCKAPL